jgi:hypothetical protein
MRLLTSILLLFIVLPVFAQSTSTMVWKPQTTSTPGFGTLTASTVSGICTAIGDLRVSTAQGSGTTEYKYSNTPQIFSDTAARCKTSMFYKNTQGNWVNYAVYDDNLTRTGTCNAPDVYDPSTRSCTPPEQTACEADAGRTFPYSKSATWPDTFIEVFTVSGALSYGAQQTACSNGCQISTISPACKVNTDGTYTCRGEAVVTGAECVAGTGNATDPGDPQVTEGETTLPPPEPETIVEEIPCTYALDSALGGLRCQSIQALEREGTTCGMFNGQNVCETKQPTNDKTTIETTIVDTSNADGSITTTKTDKATKTKCVGAKCESKESTTKTETTKDGNGSTTSSTTTCFGEACLGNGTEGGDSGGECLVDCEEADKFSTPELDEVPGFGDSVTDFTDRISEAPLLANIASIGLNGSGSCSFPSASTMIGDISFNSICENSDWLNPLYYVFLALWAFTAVRVLLSA